MAEPDKSPSKRRSFLFRLSSTLVLWGLLAAAVVLSEPILYLVLIELLALVSVWEFLCIVDVPRSRFRRALLLLVSGGYLARLFWLGYSDQSLFPGEAALVDDFFLAVLFIGLFLAEFRHAPEPGGNVRRVTVTLFGFVWIPFLFGFVIRLLFLPNASGIYYAVFLVVVTKFTDMGAYLVGSLAGKHPFMAHISPKKTWEGILGALGFALAGSLGSVWIFGDRLALIDWKHATVLALLLGAAAIAGDLAESVVKRSWQTKDSGHVLPGIGGTLDLIDSICFGAPVLYFYLRLLGQ